MLGMPHVMGIYRDWRKDREFTRCNSEWISSGYEAYIPLPWDACGPSLSHEFLSDHPTIYYLMFILTYSRRSQPF